MRQSFEVLAPHVALKEATTSLLVIRVAAAEDTRKATRLLLRTPRARTSVNLIPEEPLKDIRIVIAQMFRYDTHLDVWIERHEILSESHTSIDLIGLHGSAKGPAKGSLQSSHGHAEFGRDPRHPKLRVSVIERNHMVHETCGLVELFGDFARSNLAPNFSNQHERLLLGARKDGLVTPRHDRSTKRTFQMFSDRGRTSWPKPS
jgi:hypothetical protein